MLHPAYPADVDVEAFITNAGVTLPTGEIQPGYAAAASTEFEQETGWLPFLADASDSARTYDPPGGGAPPGGYAAIYGGRRFLLLRAGLVGLTSVSVGGAVLPSTQYRALPLNAGAKGQPSSMIEFTVPIWGQPGAVIVTGRWGYCIDIPEDAYQAVLRIAAAMALRDLSEGSLQEPIVIKEGDEERRFDPDRFGKYGSQWRAFADRVISRYKRVDFWF